MIASRENCHMERTTTIGIQAVFGDHVIVGVFNDTLDHPVHKLHRRAVPD
jgi:hypothetical protein